MSLNRPSEALKVALEWQSISPDDAEVNSALAWIMLRMGDFELAEKHASVACGLAPDGDWPLRLLAGAKFDRGNYWQANALMKRCLELAPEQAEHHYFFARTWEALGDREQSIVEARRAVELAPEDADFRRWLYAAENVHKTSNADRLDHLFKLRALLAIDPENTDVLHDLAQI